MKSVALLHTVKSVYEGFVPLLQAEIADLTVYNLLDDFLVLDANRRGAFTADNLARLKYDLLAWDLTQADAIVVTCSTLSPWLERAGQGIERPIFAIDENMTTLAAQAGGRITIMATALSAIEPVRAAILRKARALGKDVQVNAVDCTEAMTALRAGDTARHDSLLLDTARGIAETDLIVLAQASMAHMDQQIAAVCHCPVLQSPASCIAEVKRYFEEKEGTD